MKIDRRSFIAASSSALVLAKSQLASSAESAAPAETPVRQTSVAGQQVAVYTTAAKTDYRLSPTNTATFKTHGQPLETQICVFVDPAKTFQTFLGIGGALTDASAETFAKLPPAKQQEFLPIDPGKRFCHRRGRNRNGATIQLQG